MGGKEQEPGGVKELYGSDDKVDEQVEHLVASFLMEQVSQVEWQSSVKAQIVPLSVYPSGQSATHLFCDGCLKYGLTSGQSFDAQ